MSTELHDFAVRLTSSIGQLFVHNGPLNKVIYVDGPAESSSGVAYNLYMTSMDPETNKTIPRRFLTDERRCIFGILLNEAFTPGTFLLALGLHGTVDIENFTHVEIDPAEDIDPVALLIYEFLVHGKCPPEGEVGKAALQ